MSEDITFNKENYYRNIEVQPVGEEETSYGSVMKVLITGQIHEKLADHAGLVFDNPGPWHDLELTAYQALAHYHCGNCHLDMDWDSIRVKSVKCKRHGDTGLEAVGI